MAGIGVLVVDDSVVIRRIVSSVLDGDPDITVIGTAANGRIALDKLAELQPDIVILDVEMPVMDGLATLRELRRTHPTLPVVMFSTVTERGAMATLDALAAGATDYVTKPTHATSATASIERVRAELIPKIKGLVAAARTRALLARRPLPKVPTPTRPAAGNDRVDIIVIGASTGGPDALSSIVGGLRGDFSAPILVVQHMPPLFTRLFAARLDRSCDLQVTEAVDGQLVTAGHILVAPGDQHLTVRRSGADVRVRLTQEPPENYCRPSVDVLFRSAARVYGPAVVACVLTGMGRDGALGAGQVRTAGGRVIVQDEASSVVWGMPGAVVAAGVAADIVPLRQIADRLHGALSNRRAAHPRPAASTHRAIALGGAP